MNESIVDRMFQKSLNSKIFGDEILKIAKHHAIANIMSERTNHFKKDYLIYHGFHEFDKSFYWINKIPL